MGLLDDLKIKERFFTALCQNDKCHAIVGGMHIPCSGGVILFVCQKCGTASEFENTPRGWAMRAVGTLKAKPQASSPPSR